MAAAISTDMIKKLSGRERVFVDSFVDMLGIDSAFLDKVCVFIATKTNDQGLAEDMKNLTGEGKSQGCAEFIIIGLISGNIKVKELSALVQEYSVKKPLISREHYGV